VPPFAALTPKLEYTMLGRTYALGHEPNLEDWLLEKPKRTVSNPQSLWAVWYPLRRNGGFARLMVKTLIPDAFAGLRTVDAVAPNRPIVRLAALVHDIGKPPTAADGHFLSVFEESAAGEQVIRLPALGPPVIAECSVGKPKKKPLHA